MIDNEQASRGRVAVESTDGLRSDQLNKLRASYGYNRLPSVESEPLLMKFVRQFNNPLIYILLFALCFDFGAWVYEGAEGVPFESLTILVILLLNALLGVWQENKSDRALDKLKSLSSPNSWVMRDGQLQRIPSAEILPGDLVRVEAGDRIPADGTAVEAQGLMVDEATLTGESVPVDKGLQDSLYAGTLVVRGRCFLSVSAIGKASAMGSLASLLESVEREKTPLEKKLVRFGNWVALVVLAIVVAIVTVGVHLGGWSQFGTLFLFAIALAVAAVPESLPAVMTLTLALGVERMAKRKAVIKRLSAVEALGSVTVIASDKTGTLTANEMQVKNVDSSDTEAAITAMVLVNDAEVDGQVGDPLEVGLLRYAKELDFNIETIRKAHPRISVRPFDSAWKFMRVTVKSNGEVVSYIKGAPDILLDRCDMSDSDKSHWSRKIEEYNTQGYRTLALATAAGEAEEHLTWLGLILLWDPPREGVKESIQQALSAGIRVVMITGDHPATANAIAQQVGIASDIAVSGPTLEGLSDEDFSCAVEQYQVFARMTPQLKLKVVNALKKSGAVVAVTGDGVNDAPALKAADVGVAMGKRGSDVSREVADLILLDDNFKTIVAAIEEGRSIFENIQKFTRTLFSTNLTEVLLISIGAFLAFASMARGESFMLPLTAVQILWVNLLTDSLPALALAVDKNPGLMSVPPRNPKAPLLNGPSVFFTIGAGFLGGIVALLMLIIMPLFGYDAAFIQTTVFSYLVLVQLSFVFPARKVNLTPMDNLFVYLAVIAGVVLQVLAVTLPSLGQALGVMPITIEMAAILMLSITFSWIFAECLTLFLQGRSGQVRDDQRNSMNYRPGESVMTERELSQW